MLTEPALTPLGEASIYAAWRAQYLRCLAGPAFTPLGGASIYAAWRDQYLRRLAGPAFTLLGEANIYAAWQHPKNPVFILPGNFSIYRKSRGRQSACAGCADGHQADKYRDSAEKNRFSSANNI